MVRLITWQIFDLRKSWISDSQHWFMVLIFTVLIPWFTFWLLDDDFVTWKSVSAANEFLWINRKWFWQNWEENTVRSQNVNLLQWKYVLTGDSVRIISDYSGYARRVRVIITFFRTKPQLNNQPELENSKNSLRPSFFFWNTASRPVASGFLANSERPPISWSKNKPNDSLETICNPNSP